MSLNEDYIILPSKTSFVIEKLKKARRLIGAVLFIASIYFISYMLSANWDNIIPAISDFSVSTLSIAILASLLMLFFKGIYNERIISALNGDNRFNFHILYSYSISQLIRYIPGKIWGVLYQGLHLNGIIPMQVITAGNILQYIFTNLFSLLIIVSIASIYFKLEIVSLIIFLFSIFMLRYLHNSTFFSRYIMNKLEQVTQKEKCTSSPIKAEFSVTLLLLDWVFYIAIWAIILPGTADSMDFIYLSALYASASLMSLIAVFSPGGLAVREALFFFLGSYLGYNEESLLTYGLLLRLILTFSEILFALILSALKRIFYADR